MKTKEEINAYAAKYRKEHAEKLRLYAQNYYKENKAKISEKNRVYHIENREKDNEIKRAWYKKNRPRLLEEKRKYNHINRIPRHEYNESHRRRVWATRTRLMHRTNGFLVNITLDEIHEMAENIENCPICGRELRWLSGHKKVNGNSPTLDRIHNQNEMNADNVWIICHRCNTTKGDRSMEEFVEYCKNVASKFERIQMDPEKEISS
ncbi:MAG: hypothetical protein WC455_28040 [Dehalococcoidia bacterium]|jgi:hypothetical protein